MLHHEARDVSPYLAKAVLNKRIESRFELCEALVNGRLVVVEEWSEVSLVYVRGAL